MKFSVKFYHENKAPSDMRSFWVNCTSLLHKLCWFNFPKVGGLLEVYPWVWCDLVISSSEKLCHNIDREERGSDTGKENVGGKCHGDE